MSDKTSKGKSFKATAGGDDSGQYASGITQPIRTRPGNAVSESGQGNSEAGGDGIVEQAQQKVGEVAGQVGEKAGDMIGQVREQATSRLDQQKDLAAGSLWSVANAIRQTGDGLREKDQPAFAQVTDRAAEQVERLSSFLGHRDVNQIVNEVQHFARRQPALYLGGAFALGLLGARFLKSSSPSGQSSSGNGSGGEVYRVPAEGSDRYGYSQSRDLDLALAGVSSTGGYGGSYSPDLSTPTTYGTDMGGVGGTGDYSAGYSQDYVQDYSGSGGSVSGESGTDEYDNATTARQDSEV